MIAPRCWKKPGKLMELQGDASSSFSFSFSFSFYFNLVSLLFFLLISTIFLFHSLFFLTII
jgi:hypothetical protein